MNEFINYLNTMHNAKSDSKNTLAESQLMSDYYSRIEVKRDISKKISSYLKNDKGNHEAIILTGHAGDGKTSILVQVLEDFGYFDQGMRPLEVSDDFNDLFYIKDMSELSNEAQRELLLKFLQCRENGKSAIIVSNTGPIINTFKELFKKDISAIDIEKKILSGIESVDSEPIVVNSNSKVYEFRMINIANIENSYIVEKILPKVLSTDLWEDCFICNHREKCPIYNNYKMITEKPILMAKRISLIYYWLSEKGSRLTIRQMLAHITFSITANLNCKNIQDFSGSDSLLNKYSFANGFFGSFRDQKNLNFDAMNIKPIRELNNLSMDKKSLGKFDDELFVREDYDIFPNLVKERVSSLVQRSGVGISENLPLASNLRNEIRRYFILFAYSPEDQHLIENSIISEPFMDYYRAVTNDDYFSKKEKRRIEKIIFEALFRFFVGVYPTKDEESLYITLRKDFNEVQNTQMLIAKVPRHDIKVVIEKDNHKYEPGRIINKMYLKIGKNVKFPITSEFMVYMFKFFEGYVFTNLDPSFSHGVSKLKTQILEEYQVHDNEAMTLLLITGERICKMNIQVDEIEGKLFVY